MVVTHATAGTTKNGLTVTLLPGLATKGSEVAVEDGSGNLLVACASTSTTTEIATAIDGATNYACATTGTKTLGTAVKVGTLAGGTAATWAEMTTATNVTLHFTNASTTVTAAVAAINAVSGVTVTAYGTSTNTLASADADTITSLANGATGNSIKGLGFTVTKVDSSVGLYRVTFDDPAPYLVDVEAILQLASVANQHTQVGAYNSTNKTIDIQLQAINATAAQPAVGANNRVNFIATFANTGLG
jgi:hypothetical protein